MKKFTILVVLLVFLGLLGWQIYERVSSSASKGDGRRRRNAAVAVETAPVRRATIRDVGMFTGTLHPRAKFTVAPKVGGRLEKLHANIGKTVENNQLIAVLENDEYVQQVDQARAELDVSKANFEETRSALDNAKRELERVRALRQKKIASESELDTVEAQFRGYDAKHRVSQAQVAQKNAALRAAEVRLSYTKIRVVCEGAGGKWVVGERFVDEGAMLAPNSPIVTVLDIGVLTAVIHIIDRDYPKVKAGQDASISSDAFPDRKFTGKIIRIAPLIMESSREARVEIEIPNSGTLLKPGMFVRVEIEFSKHDDATVVPRHALVRRNEREGIFLADPQELKARFVPLTLGIIQGETAEVINPPLSGEVVTLGQHFLKDGAPIILPGAEPARKPRPGGKPGSGAPGKRPRGQS
ncbi:MAG: efflux RND transporter periplasmic adaptor subunit [Pseudomonadota bacterium]